MERYLSLRQLYIRSGLNIGALILGRPGFLIHHVTENRREIVLHQRKMYYRRVYPPPSIGQTLLIPPPNIIAEPFTRGIYGDGPDFASYL